MSTSLHDFMEPPGDADLAADVQAIVLHPDSLTKEQATALRTVIEARFPSEPEYGADFDFTEEISSQIRAVKAMRAAVLTESGQIKQGMGAKDIKEVVTASNTLLQTLLKTHDKILSYDRQRALEKATIGVVQSLDPDAQKLFFDRLEAELDRIN